MGKTRGKGEGSIYQRESDSKWCASITLEGGKRRVLYGKTRKEVADKLRAAQTNLKQALPIPTGRETLARFLERWLRDIAPFRVRASTLERYRGDVRLHIVPELGPLRLSEITPPRVQAMIAGLQARGLSPASIRHTRAVLRVALQQALREGLIGQNSAKLAETPRVVRKHVAALTPEHARTILTAFDDHPLQGPVTVALATGLRMGEILGLSWEDIDLDLAALHVRNQLQRLGGRSQLVPLKTENSRRTLSLPVVAVQALRRERTRQSEARLLAGPVWVQSGLVFTDAIGNGLNGSSVTHRYQKRLAAAGLEHMTWHDLRHGAASLLLSEGASMRVVMEQLGHSQINLTMNTYAHIAPTLMQDAASRLDRALGTG